MAGEIVAIVGPIFAACGPKAKELAEEVGPKVVDAADKAGDAIADAVVKAKADAKRAHSEKEKERLLNLARENTVNSCAFESTAKAFLGACEAGKAVGIAQGGYMAMPGCYAIILMPNVRCKNSSEYKQVYVGGSTSMGDDVYKHLVGGGNPDVYADVK